MAYEFDNLSVEVGTDRIATVTVDLGDRQYPVLVGHGARSELASVIPSEVRRVAVITQAAIPWEVETGPGRDRVRIEIPDGEAAKSLSVVESVCRRLANEGFTRADLVVAVGGGPFAGESIDGAPEEVFAPMSATITLEDEIDISRGDMLVKANNRPQPTQDIDAMVCWFAADKSLAGQGKYILRHTTKEVKAIVTEVCYKVNINTLHKIEEDRVLHR